MSCPPVDFAAKCESLNDAQANEQELRGRADLGVGRQEPDEDRGQAHYRDSDQQQVASAELVAEVTAENCAERPRCEADAEGCERGQKGTRRSHRRKEEISTSE